MFLDARSEASDLPENLYCMSSMFKCVKFALVSFVEKNVSFYKVSQTCGEGQLFFRSHADG